MMTVIGEEVRTLNRGAEMICEMVQRIAKDRGVYLDSEKVSAQQFFLFGKSGGR